MTVTGPPYDYTDQLKEAAHEVLSLSMTDIVERLRVGARGGYANGWRELALEAADEIERLTAKIKQYEDEQCASCRAYREIEARRALEPKP